MTSPSSSYESDFPTLAGPPAPPPSYAKITKFQKPDKKRFTNVEDFPPLGGEPSNLVHIRYANRAKKAAQKEEDDEFPPLGEQPTSFGNIVKNLKAEGKVETPYQLKKLPIDSRPQRRQAKSESSDEGGAASRENRFVSEESGFVDENQKGLEQESEDSDSTEKAENSSGAQILEEDEDVLNVSDDTIDDDVKSELEDVHAISPDLQDDVDMKKEQENVLEDVKSESEDVIRDSTKIEKILEDGSTNSSEEKIPEGVLDISADTIEDEKTGEVLEDVRDSINSNEDKILDEEGVFDISNDPIESQNSEDVTEKTPEELLYEDVHDISAELEDDEDVEEQKENHLEDVQHETIQIFTENRVVPPPAYDFTKYDILETPNASETSPLQPDFVIFENDFEGFVYNRKTVLDVRYSDDVPQFPVELFEKFPGLHKDTKKKETNDYSQVYRPNKNRAPRAIRPVKVKTKMEKVLEALDESIPDTASYFFNMMRKEDGYSNREILTNVANVILERCISDTAQHIPRYLEICVYVSEKEKETNWESIFQKTLLQRLRLIFMQDLEEQDEKRRRVLHFIAQLYKTPKYNTLIIRNCIREVFEKTLPNVDANFPDERVFDETAIGNAIRFLGELGPISEENLIEAIWTKWWPAVNEQRNMVPRADFLDLLEIVRLREEREKEMEPPREVRKIQLQVVETNAVFGHRQPSTSQMEEEAPVMEKPKLSFGKQHK